MWITEFCEEECHSIILMYRHTLICARTEDTLAIESVVNPLDYSLSTFPLEHDVKRVSGVSIVPTVSKH